MSIIKTNSIGVIPNIYSPTVKISNIDPVDISANALTTITITGVFLDFINKILISNSNNEEVLYTLISTTFDSIVLDIQTENKEDIYTLNFFNNNTLLDTKHINVLFIEVIIPDPDETGNKKFIKGSSNNNNITLSKGRYASDDGAGNGFNDHAYVGTFSSDVKIIISFKIVRLLGIQNAYTMIKYSTDNTLSTSANPRIYITAGNTLTVYLPNGTSAGQIPVNVDDKIEITLEPDNYKLVQNEQEKFNINTTINIQDIYLTFLGYRVLIVEDIEIKIY